MTEKKKNGTQVVAEAASKTIETVEKMAKEAHDETSRKARPLARKYPLTFGILTAFGLAAVLQGFQMSVGNMALFQKHPLLLLALGVLTLFVTGSLYKKLLSN